MVKLTENLSESESNIKKIIKGSIVSIGITLIALVLFACFLTYTSLSENTIPAVTIVITIISILIGSSLCMVTVKRNGIVNGAFIGLIYILVIYLLSSIIEGEFSLNTYSIIMIIGSIFSGALGGIIGVNKK